jgi:hypothetical protein
MASSRTIAIAASSGSYQTSLRFYRRSLTPAAWIDDVNAELLPQRDRQMHGFVEARRIGQPIPGDIEGGAVIDGGANDR